MNKSFRHNCAGNVALTFALMAPALLAFGGAGIDFNRYVNYQAQLSEIADTAALSGAREYLLNKAAASIAKSRAEDIAISYTEQLSGVISASVVANADNVEKSISVEITGVYEPGFLIGMFRNSMEIRTRSVAQVSGAANICVIGLNENNADTVSLDDNARVLGPDCALYSNSTDPKGLLSKSNALIDTELTCSAGGYEGDSHNFDPTPMLDCPQRSDPIEGRTEPNLGGCNYIDHEVKDYVGMLMPGVYCGGLVIDGTSHVSLGSGVYEIRDGSLQVKDVAQVDGSNVGFYFSGDSATLKFEGNSRIHLSAPMTGEMSGLLFWQSASATGSNVFEINSNFVDRLVGTIYLPNGHFLVAATSEIAEASEYTVIIADKIELKNLSKLVLNTDYDLSPVPVPQGVGHTGGDVFLRE